MQHRACRRETTRVLRWRPGQSVHGARPVRREVPRLCGVRPGPGRAVYVRTDKRSRGARGFPGSPAPPRRAQNSSLNAPRGQGRSPSTTHITVPWWRHHTAISNLGPISITAISPLDARVGTPRHDGDTPDETSAPHAARTRRARPPPSLGRGQTVQRTGGRTLRRVTRRGRLEACVKIDTVTQRGHDGPRRHPPELKEIRTFWSLPGGGGESERAAADSELSPRNDLGPGETQRTRQTPRTQLNLGTPPCVACVSPTVLGSVTSPLRANREIGTIPPASAGFPVWTARAVVIFGVPEMRSAALRPRPLVQRVVTWEG